MASFPRTMADPVGMLRGDGIPPRQDHAMNHLRQAPNAIYLHNEEEQPRAQARPSTSRIARAEAETGPRMAPTRIIRRTEFRGVGDEQPRGSRLRARWLAACIGG